MEIVGKNNGLPETFFDKGYKKDLYKFTRRVAFIKRNHSLVKIHSKADHKIVELLGKLLAMDPIQRATSV